jgi:hypothetical protein
MDRDGHEVKRANGRGRRINGISYRWRMRVRNLRVEDGSRDRSGGLVGRREAKAKEWQFRVFYLTRTYTKNGDVIYDCEDV